MCYATGQAIYLSFCYMRNNNQTIQDSTNNSSAVMAVNPSEMGMRNSITSIEIAEEAGRNHKDVMRSVREMESAWMQVNGRKFALVEYIDRKGESRPCYQFNYEEFMYVISKFDDVTRAKLVTRWAKLETGQETPIYQQVQQEQPKPLPLKDKLMWVKEVSKLLKLNDTSTLGLLQKIANPLGLPTPEYTSSKGILKPATKLLAENGSSLSIIEFNNKMIEKGFLETLSRNSSKGLIKKFKNITKKGLEWGENLVNPKSPKQTQPLYYADKFPQLLKLLA